MTIWKFFTKRLGEKQRLRAEQLHGRREERNLILEEERAERRDLKCEVRLSKLINALRDELYRVRRQVTYAEAMSAIGDHERAKIRKHLKKLTHKTEKILARILDLEIVVQEEEELEQTEEGILQEECTGDQRLKDADIALEQKKSLRPAEQAMERMDAEAEDVDQRALKLEQWKLGLQERELESLESFQLALQERTENLISILDRNAPLKEMRWELDELDELLGHMASRLASLEETVARELKVNAAELETIEAELSEERDESVADAGRLDAVTQSL